MANEQDFVDLTKTCTDIYNSLERGMGKKKPEDLSKPMCDALVELKK